MHDTDDLDQSAANLLLDHPSRQAPAPGVWRPEPGLCGWLLDPRQRLVPAWLAELINGHLRPRTTGVIAPAIRVACSHIDWELAWLTDPDLFWRGLTSVGAAPEPTWLWEASSTAAEAGRRLILDVQIEPVKESHLTLDTGEGRASRGASYEHDGDTQPAIVVYGAGIEGELPDPLWAAIAPVLTTCGSTLFEPRHDYLKHLDESSTGPRPPFIPRSPLPGTRPIGTRVAPEGRFVGDWPHTWWNYPRFATRAPGCLCSAHAQPTTQTSEFGPAGASV
ncbi:hypothetical protein [Labedaea rhizosphaerae]|uniref:hypothetical protein n=1 Tax=Labedaea rhizosphaerae TaxID=598644 RepID=UPI00105D0A9E|nr:hypothetical protein [Labedaea rhizosphaerae]